MEYSTNNNYGGYPAVISQNGKEPALEGVEPPKSLMTGLRPVFDADPNAGVKVKVKGLNFYYGTHRALTDINLDVREKQVTALIGPSGSGKTTFIRTLN